MTVSDLHCSRDRGAVDELVITPLVPGDRRTVLDVFLGMSPESRWRRFNAGVVALSEMQLRVLADAVDGDRHVALVGRIAGQPIAVARFVRWTREPLRADVALSVVDAYQGKGIGSAMLSAVVSEASALGLHELTFSIQADNTAARRLVERLGARGRIEAGTYEASVGTADAARTFMANARLRGSPARIPRPTAAEVPPAA